KTLTEGARDLKLHSMLKGGAVKAGIKRTISRASLRRLAAVVVVVLALQTALFTLVYNAALDHLRRHDPRQLQNRSEVCFYFAPLKVRVGEELSGEELVFYLRELGYEERTDGIPAS